MHFRKIFLNSNDGLNEKEVSIFSIFSSIEIVKNKMDDYFCEGERVGKSKKNIKGF